MLFLFLIFEACNQKQKKNEVNVPQEIIPVKTILSAQENMEQNIHTSGVFTTEDETYFGFKMGGILQHIYVKEGDAIRPGQLIASLNLTEIKAQVQQAQIGLEKAQRDYKRASNLYRDSVATLEQFQNSKSALEVSQEQFNAAKFNQNFAEIRATKSGYILKKLANDGQVVGPGTPIVLANGTEQSNWVLKVSLSDRDWASIELGDQSELMIDAIPGQKYTGKIVAKSEGVDPITGTLWASIKCLHLPTQKLAVGIIAKATIIPKKQIKSWVIPYDALLDGNANEGYIFIISPTSTAKKVAVKIDKIAHGKVYISSGIENSMEVIVSGNAYLNEGTKIKIIR